MYFLSFPERTIKTARLLGFKAWIEILNPGVSKSPSTISNDAVLEQVWQKCLRTSSVFVSSYVKSRINA